MKKIITCLLLSLFFTIGSGEVFADNRGDRGRDRKEQRDNRRNGSHENRGRERDDRRGNNNRPGYKGRDQKGKDSRHWKDNKDYRPGKGHSMPAPGYDMRRHEPGRHHTPPPPPRPRRYAPPPPPPRRPNHYAPVPPPPPPHLGYMVDYVTRGCRDVAVWQIDYNTYIVKFRRGNRFYTQYLYPYDDMYGDRSLITVNWQPLSPWTLIPPIQLNINL